MNPKPRVRSPGSCIRPIKRAAIKNTVKGRDVSRVPCFAQYSPAYELQLPYGVVTAARMNAEAGTSYDVGKLLGWCFDRGPLRGWGSIVGNWNGQSVSGLIGEANDQGDDYAFVMNGFQQAGALAPLIKYDKRYARAVAKWILNVANASRLFYSAYLPEQSQDDYVWSHANDPESVIAYEALKQNWQSNHSMVQATPSATGGRKRTSASMAHHT